MNAILALCICTVIHGTIAQETDSTERSFISAIKSGDVAKVELLIKNGGNLNTNIDEDDYSPLRTAVLFTDNDKIIDSIIKSGNADLNEVDKNKLTLLHIAVAQGHEKATELLLLAGDNDYVNRADRWGNIPLHTVMDLGESPTILEILYNYGANVNQTNDENESPLYVGVHTSK